MVNRSDVVIVVAIVFISRPVFCVFVVYNLASLFERKLKKKIELCDEMLM